MAQAEHDPEALAIFITTRADLAQGSHRRSQAAQPSTIPSRAKLSIATAWSSSRRRVDEAREITNRLAPEHLTVDAAADLDWVQNAGSVFVGRWSAQPMGDYISGPNHTLPTGGMARVRGGLSVNDFVKLITVQQYAQQALRALGPKPRCWPKPKASPATPKPFAHACKQGGAVAESAQRSAVPRPAPACRR